MVHLEVHCKLVVGGSVTRNMEYIEDSVIISYLVCLIGVCLNKIGDTPKAPKQMLLEVYETDDFR